MVYFLLKAHQRRVSHSSFTNQRLTGVEMKLLGLPLLQVQNIDISRTLRQLPDVCKVTGSEDVWYE